MTSASQHASHALVRQTSDAPPVLAIDLPDLRIGIAEYDEGPTGCTVFAFDRPALVATDVRGGLPGVFMAGGRSRSSRLGWLLSLGSHAP